jgi:xanthine dehydrogenase YagR molybdenum-binding subunit
MPASWPQKPNRLIGSKVQRLDGPDKATGQAKYSYDKALPGLLHAVMLRSPHAHAKITKLDVSAAEQSPGFKALHVVTGEGKEVIYAGDEILAVAADTEEHAHDAVRAIKIEYDILPHLVREEDALKNQGMKTAPPQDNIRPGGEATSDGFETAMAAADVIIEGVYGVSVVCHQCLESHGLVAQWEGDNLTVWASTQAVTGTAGGLAQYFKIPVTQVKCITHYMGGGFGSKFGPDIQGIVAAELARKAKAPVKLMLDRASEITAGGNRPSAIGTIRMAGTKEGKIVAYEADMHGTPGVGGGAGMDFQRLPYVYLETNAAGVPNIQFKKKNTVVRINAGGQRAMRAPGHPQSCFLTDCPLDDLAAQIGMDPMKVRLLNLPPNDEAVAKKDPTSWKALWNTIYTEEIKIAAGLADWEKKWHPPGKGPIKGPIKHGIGMALHTWGGGGFPINDVTVGISSDGSVLITSSTQDLGTGQRTVLAIVIAEILGLDVKDVTVRIGDSPYGRSTGSGGSTTCPGTAPVALQAAAKARDALFTAIAPRLKAKEEDLAIKPGKVADTANKKEWSWKEACARLGMDSVKEMASSPSPADNARLHLSNVQVGGVQIAEVLVDTETGVVRCTKVVAVQDCGLIINKLGCESQVAGGVIMGVNYALFEERIMDRNTGRQTNPDMEFYKLGGIEDMPQIVVHMHDMPQRGVIGIGEPPTISTAAAIGNAIFNALGVRIGQAPFTPERVLERLARPHTAIKVTWNHTSDKKGGQA